jgi:hypothetical protein
MFWINFLPDLKARVPDLYRNTSGGLDGKFPSHAYADIHVLPRDRNSPMGSRCQHLSNDGSDLLVDWKGH